MTPVLPSATSDRWDQGRLRHLLPTVSDSRILIKASFDTALTFTPHLRVGDRRVDGRMTDTAGECWVFDADGLDAGRLYTLSLAGPDNALCEPWTLATFPRRDARVERCRILFFACAGGHESLGHLPTSARNRLLRRALSFQPQAVVANGDHVYWDQRTKKKDSGFAKGASPLAVQIAGKFDRSLPVLGDRNEEVLKRAAGPQIVPVYGVDFRSTPVFFVQDDHDYFDNDKANDRIVTFPPSWFMMQLARATRAMYYPEFLPDEQRPAGLPWASISPDAHGVSESFGTIRYGNLAEILLYDARRTLTLAGPSAVLVDPEVETWLNARAASDDVEHLVHAPSLPPGWSSGKWCDWYPDLLGKDGELTTRDSKPYWQPGWLAQHDRILSALSAMKARAPLMIGGDLHAIAAGRIRRSGLHDFSNNPVTTVVAGPIGTDPEGWPSHSRGTPPRVPNHLEMREHFTAVEQHGFTMLDFYAGRMQLQFFRWDRSTQSVEDIDELRPFHTLDVARPG
jgi:hypothetical protein